MTYREGIRTPQRVDSADARDETGMEKQPHILLRTDDVKAIVICARLRDGAWINFRTTCLDEPPPWAGKTLQLLGADCGQ